MYTSPLLPRRQLVNPVLENRVAPRRNAYATAEQLHAGIDKLFDSMFTGFFSPWPVFDTPDLKGQRENALTILPRLDVISETAQYAVSVEIPGVKPDEVKLEVRDNALFIHGEKKQEHKEEKTDCYVRERSYGSFERVLVLPEDAAIDGIKASHKDGVLTIIIPRKEAEKPQARHIEIN